MSFLTELPHRISSKLSKQAKGSEKLLKIIFLSGTLLFTVGLLIFKFSILSELNQLELPRLSLIKDLTNFGFGITDPIQGFLQFISVNIFKEHQIFAMKLPTALMLSLSLICISAFLYIKFRNRYLPYTYLLLATTSPLIILLGHQSYIPGIDTAFLASTIIACHFAVTSTELRTKLKALLYLSICLSLGLLTLQTFGIPLFLFALILTFRSTELRYQILAFKKLTKIGAYLLIILPIVLNIYINYKNRDFWQTITGYQNLKDILPNLKEIANSTKTIFGIGNTSSVNTGTLRPDFLLIACTILAVYEALKKLRGRVLILAIFGISLILSGLLGGINSIIFAALIAPIFISLALANMVGIIDVAFPINPYPRNIAKSFILSLICILSLLNIYVFMTSTIRQNLPSKIDLYYELRK